MIEATRSGWGEDSHAPVGLCLWHRWVAAESLPVLGLGGSLDGVTRQRPRGDVMEEATAGHPALGERRSAARGRRRLGITARWINLACYCKPCPSTGNPFGWSGARSGQCVRSDGSPLARPGSGGSSGAGRG
jgi:hypothetical protein